MDGELDRDARRAPPRFERLVPVSAVELTGRHMLGNVVAAAAVADGGGVPASRAMTQALRGFPGLEHVMEPVAGSAACSFVNDSKATNVEAARRSIESFEGGVVALSAAGSRAATFGELRAPLAASGRGVVAIGEAAALVRAALHGVPVVEAASMREAVARRAMSGGPDGVVLLAPACASFDWFKDYAERDGSSRRRGEATRRGEGTVRVRGCDGAKRRKPRRRA